MLAIVFISTGTNHDRVAENLKNNGLHPDIHFFHDKNLEYEQNAYLNFLTLLNCNVFVGNSRSTFSNLVTMTRCIQQNNHENYIYNTSNNKLVKKELILEYIVIQQKWKTTLWSNHDNRGYLT